MARRGSSPKTRRSKMGPKRSAGGHKGTNKFAKGKGPGLRHESMMVGKTGKCRGCQ